MSDYTTHNEGVGTTGLVVAAVLIGLFILVLAMLGGNSGAEGELGAPAVITEEAPAVPAAPATDG